MIFIVIRRGLLWQGLVVDESRRPPPDFLSASPEFCTTHWSNVLTAADRRSPQSTAALERLCRAYWYPLYAHVRRRGHGPDEAQDLTQEFFARLLERNDLAAVSPHKGKFRSFLLAAMNHFLANEWDRARAAKRGGGQVLLSLDETRMGEERFLHEPAGEAVSQHVFDRAWALTLLDQALRRLESEFAEAGKALHYAEWKLFLSREATASEREAAGARLGMTSGAVAVAVHRFRQRYGELLRAEVAQTVMQPGDVAEEWRYLFTLLNQ